MIRRIRLCDPYGPGFHPKLKFAAWLALVLILAAAASKAQAPPRNPGPQTSRVLAQPVPQPPVVDYAVSLAGRADHLVHVQMNVPAGRGNDQVQLPVWNALYQVRDFAQYVRTIKASNAAGQSLPIRKLDKTTWQITGGEKGSVVDYDIIADIPGPFGAQLNNEHAFFNLAEILMYPVGARAARVKLTIINIPEGWWIISALEPMKVPGPSRSQTFTRENYDRLVDSPFEIVPIGKFQEADFSGGHAHYRVVIHGDAEDSDVKAVAASLKKIAAAAVDWMQDQPFDDYTFIYHVPKGPAGGGMEHAYSTAIDVSAAALRNGLGPLESVSAHEFFHLWNVKRIRPASLEPVDYTKENYTRALWFSEGVDSTVSEYILLNAGLSDERRFLQHFAAQIRELQRRPAHLTQSVEESSLDAWLEKYPAYNQAQRSVNYYNKGEILGYLLDLAVRDASNDRASLRDVFQWMNQHYAKQGRFFPDSAGVQEAAEAVSGAKLGWFFQKYVAGSEELPYDDLMKTVGLRLDRHKVSTASLGFAMAFSGDAPIVASVEPGSHAEAAGLREGDTIVSMNDSAVNRGRRWAFAGMSPGDTMKLKIRGRDGAEREVNFKLGSREEDDFALVDLDNVSPAQRARRKLWLSSRDQAPERSVAQ